MKSEFNLWKTKWIRENDDGLNIPNNALVSFIHCDKDIYY
jgi:hypothetical protein